MRVISKENVNIITDRQGTLSGKIAIDVWQDRKDDLGKEYHIWTRDTLILEDGTETEIRDRNGRIQIKEYIYSYEEYDSQRANLEVAFPTNLTGSEKDDYLLQSGLLVNLSLVPIYGLIGGVGEKYSRV